MIASVSVIVGLSACASAGSPDIVIRGEPTPLPEVELAAIDASTFQSLLAGQKGRPVVVNVWASWCGPCRVEAPLLDRAAESYGDDVLFLGVASKDERDGAAKFLRRYDIDYPNVLDVDGSVRRFLRLRGFPTTYVFDRTGRLLVAEVGGISEQNLAGRIEDVLRT